MEFGAHLQNALSPRVLGVGWPFKTCGSQKYILSIDLCAQNNDSTQSSRLFSDICRTPHRFCAETFYKYFENLGVRFGNPREKSKIFFAIERWDQNLLEYHVIGACIIGKLERMGLRDFS